MELTDILEQEASEEFLNLLQIYSKDDYNPDFVHKMKNAVVTSYFKYGGIRDKPESHYNKLGKYEVQDFTKDKNLEHMVNVANYAMFRYMIGGGNISPEDLVNVAVEAMKRYTKPEKGEYYEGTDSNKSSNREENKVSRFLRQLLEDSSYEFFDQEDESFHFSTLL